MGLTTPTNLPESDPTLDSDTTGVLANRALLTQLANGEWLPFLPEEIVAALTLLAQELSVALTTLAPAISGDPSMSRPVAGRIAWR
jgi:hypothetical protein